jgi:hypothetical protein
MLEAVHCLLSTVLTRCMFTVMCLFGDCDWSAGLLLSSPVLLLLSFQFQLPLYINYSAI